MNKRRGEQSEDASPSKMARPDQSARHAKLKAYVTGLNQQFASWVASQQADASGQLWIEGVKDYIKHAEGMLDDFKDIVDAERQRLGEDSTAAGPEQSPSLFKLPPTATPAPSTTFPLDFGAEKAAADTSKPPLGGSTPAFGSKPPGVFEGFNFGAAADNPLSAEPSAPATTSAAATTTAFPSTTVSFGSAMAAAATVFGGGAVVATTSSSSPSGSVPFSFGAGFASSAKDTAAAAAAKESGSAAGGDTSPATKPFSFGTLTSSAAATGAFAVSSSTSLADQKTTSSPAGTSPPKPMFQFGGPSSSSAAAATSASNGMFNFGGATATGGAFATADGAAANTAASSGAGAFGVMSAASGAASSSSLFGSSFAPASTSAAASAFSFPAMPSSSAPAGGLLGSAAPGAGGDGEGGDEEETQQFDSNVGVDESAAKVMFKAKGKLYHLVKATDGGAGEWASKGIGSVMLRQPKDASARPFVTFTTEAGRVLFISTLNKTMKISTDASNTASFSAYGALDNQAAKLHSLRVKFGKDKHKEFATAAEGLQAHLE